MDILVDATSRYLIAQAKAGAEVLQLFDSWAGVLSAAHFRSLVIEPTRRIVENVQVSHARYTDYRVSQTRWCDDPGIC